MDTGRIVTYRQRTTVAYEVREKIANVWTVVAILLAELVAAKTKAAPPVVDEKRSEAARKAAATRRANAAKARARSRRPRAPRATDVLVGMAEAPVLSPAV